ncbi:hypothetical protein [Falsiroseomonas sp. HW251]|uniref:hypothetical protein n=1 Tax=Falsiroseomonas sp. HW251 TaxID=3390998 RepID=UPI003D3101EC
MLTMLIAVARALLGIGTIATVAICMGVGGVAAQEARIDVSFGAVLGALIGLVLASITFGIAAAIFDIQRRTRRMLEIAERNARQPQY